MNDGAALMPLSIPPRPNRPHWYLITVELDAACVISRRLARLNPIAKPGSPIFELCILRERPDGVEHLPNQGTSAVSRTHGVRIASELCSRHSTEIGALAAQERLAAKLRREGAWVRNPQPQATRRVYVVLLRPEVAAEPSVVRVNPESNHAQPCLYVGETGLTEDARLEQHLSGIRASKWAERYGERLAPEFNSRAGEVMTRLATLRWERDLTRLLRKRGFTVLGGH